MKEHRAWHNILLPLTPLIAEPSEHESRPTVEGG
jgi:hypothetical protein